MIRNRCLECWVLYIIYNIYSLLSAQNCLNQVSKVRLRDIFQFLPDTKSRGAPRGVLEKSSCEGSCPSCGLGYASGWVTEMAFGLPRTWPWGSAYHPGTSHLRSLTPASSSEWAPCWFAASLLGVLLLVVVLQAAPGPGALHCCSVHANPQAATIVHCWVDGAEPKRKAVLSPVQRGSDSHRWLGALGHEGMKILDPSDWNEFQCLGTEVE